MTFSRSYLPFLMPILSLPLVVCAALPKMADDDSGKPVSFFKKIRPIFQANCNGCHQPAKAKGGYIMTDFAKLLEGGECVQDGKKAVTPKDPAASFLIAQITPGTNGAEMPPKKAPLTDTEIQLIRRWIEEGAVDDTPANARQRHDAAHPPVYSRPPLVTSLDVSPNGTLLAVAGFNEVLLWKTGGTELLTRLIGMSERIQTVRFSPDGKRLAACGGRPAQAGEIQIWDVEKRTLTASIPAGFDTVYGVNWSPDGKLLAYGGPDNVLRAVSVETGQQVLQQTSHSDWVLDTVFTHKGDQLVSVGRDMSTKLTEVATQRFVDNISSITPGALRGGLHAVARHPERDEFLVGGSDGIPQAYRLNRKTQRRIGDNALCIRKWPEMPGRIYAADFARDGKRFAAASSLDGKGAVHFYNYDFATEMPDEFVKIEGKAVGERTDDEKKRIEAHYHADVKLLASFTLDSAVYSLRWLPDGSGVYAAGEDGKVRFITPDGKVAREFVPVPITGATAGK